ncbi:pilus assembly protein TadE [Novosphingobium sp. THN1]|uniref:TadE/TadG family type IV pilus assembly protein n=1 Tax=Novosphingobium sp. THN1 TaxID=1016987 RepID=UPI000E4AFBAF|nr:pilus assembly protein TadE [Novosphingobium sp. THN1]AXU17975.1 pilus assembly protein TadE [Novosphingobium sp. THN1]
MTLLRRLLDRQDGVSTVEFALVVPLFMILGMYGAEIAWLNAASMEASQVALALADNASRLGQTDNSGVTPTVTSNDVQSVLTGALEEGSDIGLAENGRVILSSVEVHPVTGKQYIHWQKCMGQRKQASAHGKPDATGSALSAIASGISLGGRKVTSSSNSAVMVAEVWYEYNGLFGTMFVQPITIHEQAAIIVRDDRNVGPGLSGTNNKIDC